MKFFENWQRKKLEHQKKLIQQVDDGYIVTLSTGKYKAKDLEEVCILLYKQNKIAKYTVFFVVFFVLFLSFADLVLVPQLIFFTSENIANFIVLYVLFYTTILVLTDLEKFTTSIDNQKINKIDYNNKQTLANTFFSKIIEFPFICNANFIKFFIKLYKNKLFFLILHSIYCICATITLILFLSAIFGNNFTYHTAIKISNIYQKFNPTSVKNYEIRGRSKAFLGDLEGAKNDFTLGYKYSKKDEDKSNFLYYLINTNLDLVNRKEALGNLEEYKKLLSKDGMSIYLIKHEKMSVQKIDMLVYAAMLGDIELQNVISAIDKKIPLTHRVGSKDKLIFNKVLMNKAINTEDSLKEAINDLEKTGSKTKCKAKKAAIADMKASIYEQAGDYCKAVQEYDKACNLTKNCTMQKMFLYNYARYKCIKEE